MAIEQRIITNREEWLRWRLEDITASEIATLIGDAVHPYRTAFELWALKSGYAKDATVETPEMRRGRALEAIVIDMVREKRPEWAFLIGSGSTYYRDPDAHIGATPDALAVRDDGKQGVVQIKTANEHAFRRHWRNEDGEVETPLWIAIQATVEAFLTGSTWAAVGVLEMAKWQVHIEDIELKPAMMEELCRLAADFWRRVETGESFPAHWKNDANLIARLFAEPDHREIDLRGDNRILDMLNARNELKKAEALGSAAEKTRKLIDTEIIMKMGNADQAALPDGTTLLAPVRRRGAYQVQATSWRQISVKGGRA